MTAGISAIPSARPTPRLSSGAVPILVLAGALTVFAAIRTALLAVAAGSPSNCLAMDIASACGALYFYNLRYSEIPSLLRPLMRGIAGVVLIQVAFDGSTLLYGPAPMLTGANGAFFCLGTAIAIAAGLGGAMAAQLRPAAAVPLRRLPAPAQSCQRRRDFRNRLSQHAGCRRIRRDRGRIHCFPHQPQGSAPSTRMGRYRRVENERGNADLDLGSRRASRQLFHFRLDQDPGRWQRATILAVA